jgi:hypothetical protein
VSYRSPAERYRVGGLPWISLELGSQPVKLVRLSQYGDSVARPWPRQSLLVENLVFTAG